MYFCREISEADLGALPDLAAELGYKVTIEEIKETFSCLENDETNKLFIAETEDKMVIGWVHVSIYRTLITKKTAIVLGLVVSSDYRKAGIGRMLMEKAELWAQAKGCLRIRLYSNITRTEAHQFYHRLGYEETANSLLLQKCLDNKPSVLFHK